MAVFDGGVIEDVVVGDGDGAAFFHVFDLGIVAFAAGLGVKGAFGAVSETIVAQGFRCDDGNCGERAGKFVLEDTIFGPRIEAVENDAFLTRGNEILSFGDGLAGDPILAFGSADHFTESFFAFTIRGALDTTFVHFAVDHTPEVDFGGAAFGKVVDGDGFAAACHPDDGKNFDV